MPGGGVLLCIYKALIKKELGAEDLSLPRNSTSCLMNSGICQIDKLDKMITVGRSRKNLVHMVVQSFAQLQQRIWKKRVRYVTSNCGLKCFIGSNDIDTCKDFPSLRNITVYTPAFASSWGIKRSDKLFSRRSRPPAHLPPPICRSSNKTDTGNASRHLRQLPAQNEDHAPSYK
jgi:type IV secretion system protein VirD4